MNINAVRKRIRCVMAEKGITSPPLLLAISKTRTASELLQAHQAGLQDFGENYLQEALEKIDALQAHKLVWHFTGPIQSNKTRSVAEHFSWVHTVDRVKIARRLSEQRPAGMDALQVCIQVNIDHEDSKSGVLPEDLAVIAADISALPNIQLRGLMVIPKVGVSLAERRQSFSYLADLLVKLQLTYPMMDTLSMGMSDDFELAVAQGATIVRIGSAIFGSRIKNMD